MSPSATVHGKIDYSLAVKMNSTGNVAFGKTIVPMTTNDTYFYQHYGTQRNIIGFLNDGTPVINLWHKKYEVLTADNFLLQLIAFRVQGGIGEFQLHQSVSADFIEQKVQGFFLDGTPATGKLTVERSHAIRAMDNLNPAHIASELETPPPTFKFDEEENL